MNRCRLAITTVAAALAVAVASPALACGEGQFNMGQGLRYQGYLAPRPANVLVYDDSGTGERAALYAGLQKAGHTVTVVHDADALSQALHQRRYDVVIAYANDAAMVASDGTGDAAAPRLLPVVARSRRDAPDVLARFRLYVLDGASLGQYLKRINQLLALRAP